jgi:hypothetical protein
MAKRNYPFRLRPSLMEEARKVAESEGVALNQLIIVALAEKLSALRPEEYFQERILRADRAETLRILDRSGKGKPPMERDELPPDLAPDAQRVRETSKPTGRATTQFGKLKKQIEKYQAIEFGDLISRGTKKEPRPKEPSRLRHSDPTNRPNAGSRNFYFVFVPGASMPKSQT